MNIIMTGGTGLIGKALAGSLRKAGHSIWILTRRESAVPLEGIHFMHWNGNWSPDWGNLVPKMDAVINLAGESLNHWPWSKSRKKEFWESRLRSGEALTEAFRVAIPKPKVFIQVSGINHYGLQGSPADESMPPGVDFLSRLTVAWEGATQELESMGIRRCVVRLAVVLAKKGGLFPLMSLPARLFLGGPQGNGGQVIPWIHLDDVVGAIRFLLEQDHTSGSYNLVAPQIITNQEFNRTIAAALHRPFWFTAPSFLLKTFLGEMSVLVLEGRGAVPGRLVEAGYQFQFETLQEAMSQLT